MIERFFKNEYGCKNMRLKCMKLRVWKKKKEQKFQLIDYFNAYLCLKNPPSINYFCTIFKKTINNNE